MEKNPKKDILDICVCIHVKPNRFTTNLKHDIVS